MDLKSLGRRDIFGILLPGVIVVFVSVYVLFGIFGGLSWPSKDSLGFELLLSVLLFVASYLAGSLLRLHAVIDVDEGVSNYLVKKWRWECKRAKLSKAVIDGLEREFKDIKAKLAQGEKVEASDVQSKPASVWARAKVMYRRQDDLEFDDWFSKKFDEWIWGVDEFPYPAWMNRLWQSGDFCTISDFFLKDSKTSIWLRDGDMSDKWRRRDFFNYCKMAVIGCGGQISDEVRENEGLTRFFAGTVAALRLSFWLLIVPWLVVALICVWNVALFRAWKLGIASFSPVLSTFQGFYLMFTPIFVLVVELIRLQIVKHFRQIRHKEVHAVYHAFYFYSLCHPELTVDGVGQGKQQARWRDRLQRYLAVLFA